MILFSPNTETYLFITFFIGNNLNNQCQPKHCHRLSTCSVSYISSTMSIDDMSQSNELSRYLSMKNDMNDYRCDVLTFWKSNTDELPCLSQVNYLDKFTAFHLMMLK